MTFTNIDTQLNSFSFRQSSESPLSDHSRPHVQMLSEGQHRKLQEMMNKTVFMETRDKKASYPAPATFIVDAFVRSFKNLFFSYFRSEPLYVPPEIYHQRMILLEATVKLRGSTTGNLILKKPLKSDLDFFIGIPNIQCLFQTAEDFKQFNYLLAVHMLETLFPELYPSIFFDASFRSYSISPIASSLISKEKGIFLNILPHFETKKAIFGMLGTHPLKQGLGCDLDITFLYPDDRVAASRCLTPSSISSALSELDSINSSDNCSEGYLDPCSFGHDAVEIIIPSIDLLVRPYFSGLFGYRVDQVEDILRTRELVILDTHMYQGYCRLFLEMNRGRLSLQKSAKVDVELPKMVKLISRQAIHQSRAVNPSLSTLYKFIQKKSSTPKQALLFFLNSYQIIALIQEAFLLAPYKEMVTEEEIVSIQNLAKVYREDFIHPAWQQIFPPSISNVSSLSEDPIHLFHLLNQLILHFGKVSGSQVILSLHQNIRLAKLDEESSFYILGKECSFQDLKASQTVLQQGMSPWFHEHNVLPLLVDLSDLRCPEEEKWLLLYCIRRLEQESLAPTEIENVFREFPLFLSLWIKYADKLNMFSLTSLTKKHLLSFYPYLFESEEETAFFQMIFETQNRLIASNPSLLPALLWLILRMNTLKYETASLPLKEDPLQGLTQPLVKIFLNVLLLTREPKHKRILFRCLAPLSCHFTQNIFKKFSHFWEEMYFHWSPQGISQETMNALLLLLDSAATSFPIPAISERPIDRWSVFIFHLLDLNKSQRFFDVIFQEETLSIFKLLLSVSPVKILTMLEQKIQREKQLDVFLFEKLTSDLEARRLLLQSPSWLLELCKHDEKIALQAFIKLRSPHLKEELAPFIFKLNVLNPQFAIDCFFKTGVTLQKLVFLEFLPAISPSIERIALTLSKETLESILILLQDDSLQQRHPEDLARLTFSLLAEYVKQPQPNLFILQNLIESQLPTICYLRREKKIPASARWLPFLHFLSKHLEVAALKIDAQSALLQELCELDAKNVDFSTYLRWATQQPFSEELSMAVASKVEIATLQENTFLTALSFMQSAQQKKLLLKKGIESHLDPELLCSLLVSTFSEHRDFLSQLESLKQIASYFGNTSAPAELIHQMRVTTSLGDKERMALLESANLIAKKHPHLLKSLIQVVNHPSALGSNKANYIYVLSALLLSEDLFEDDWSLMSILYLLKSAEKSSDSLTYTLFKERLLITRPLNLLEALDAFPPTSSSYLELLKIFLKKEELQTHFQRSKHPAFTDVQKQLARCEALTLSGSGEDTMLLKLELPSLKIAYFITYLKEIAADPKNITFICSTISELNAADLSRILSRISTLGETIPKELFYALITTLERNSCISPLSTHQHQLLGNYFSSILRHISTNETLDFAKIYYLTQPQDIHWSTSFSALFHKATLEKNIPLLIWLQDKIPQENSAKKLKSYKEDFLKYLSSSSSARDIFDTLAIARSYTPSLQLDYKKIHFQLFKRLLEYPYHEMLVNDTMLFLKKSLGLEDTAAMPLSGKNMLEDKDISRDERLRCEKQISKYLSNLSASALMEHRTLLYRLHHMGSEVLESSIQKLFAKHLLAFTSFITSNPPSDALFEELKEYDLIITAIVSQGMHYSSLVKNVLQEAVIHLVDTFTLCSINKKHVIAYLGLYALISQWEKDVSGNAKDFVKAYLPYISKGNFEFCPDPFFLFSYIRLGVSLDKILILNDVIDGMAKYASESTSQKDKSALASMLFKHIIPISILHSLRSPLPVEKVLQLILMLGKDISLNDKEFENVLSIFNLYIASINSKTSHFFTPSADHNCEGVIKTIPLGTAKIFFGNTIQKAAVFLRTHFRSEISWDSLAYLTNSISELLSSNIWVNEEFVTEVVLLSKTIVNSILQSKMLAATIDSFQSIEKQRGRDILHTSLSIPCQIFQNFVPGLLDQIQIYQSAIPSMAAISTKDIARSRDLFLLKLTKEITKKSSIGLSSLIYFFQTVHLNGLENYLNHFSSFLDVLKEEKELGKAIEQTMNILGLAFCVQSVREDILQPENGQIDPQTLLFIADRSIEAVDASLKAHLNRLLETIFIHLGRILLQQTKPLKILPQELFDLLKMSFIVSPEYLSPHLLRFCQSLYESELTRALQDLAIYSISKKPQSRDKSKTLSDFPNPYLIFAFIHDISTLSVFYPQAFHLSFDIIQILKNLTPQGFFVALVRSANPKVAELMISEKRPRLVHIDGNSQRRPNLKVSLQPPPAFIQEPTPITPNTSSFFQTVQNLFRK